MGAFFPSKQSPPPIRDHLQSEPTSNQSPPPIRAHLPSESTSNQSPSPSEPTSHQSSPPIRAHLPSEPTSRVHLQSEPISNQSQPITAHLQSEPTSNQSPPPIRAHLQSEPTSNQSPPPIRAHLLIRAHLQSQPTSNHSPPPITAHLQSEPLIRAHLQSEPTPHVATAGCQGSLWWLGLHLSADVQMTGWDKGKPAALEIIVTSSLTPAILNGSWQMTGASSPASRKLQSNGPKCKSWTFITRLASHLVDIHSSPKPVAAVGRHSNHPCKVAPTLFITGFNVLNSCILLCQ